LKQSKRIGRARRGCRMGGLRRFGRRVAAMIAGPWMRSPVPSRAR